MLAHAVISFLEHAHLAVQASADVFYVEIILIPTIDLKGQTVFVLEVAEQFAAVKSSAQKRFDQQFIVRPGHSHFLPGIIFFCQQGQRQGRIDLFYDLLRCIAGAVLPIII